MAKLVSLIKRDWPKLLLLASIFVMGIWIGEQLPRVNPKAASELREMAMERFKEIAAWMRRLPLGTGFLIIWVNNINASLTAILFGVLLPVMPLTFLIMNGVLIGLFQNIMELENGISPLRFYLSLAPHGLLELPAFFIAVFLGIHLGLIPYRLIIHYLRTKEHLPLIKEALREVGHYGVLIIIMLFFAALIEVSVSPLLLGL